MEVPRNLLMPENSVSAHTLAVALGTEVSVFCEGDDVKAHIVCGGEDKWVYLCSLKSETKRILDDEGATRAARFVHAATGWRLEQSKDYLRTLE